MEDECGNPNRLIRCRSSSPVRARTCGRLKRSTAAFWVAMRELNLLTTGRSVNPPRSLANVTEIPPAGNRGASNETMCAWAQTFSMRYRCWTPGQLRSVDGDAPAAERLHRGELTGFAEGDAPRHREGHVDSGRNYGRVAARSRCAAGAVPHLLRERLAGSPWEWRPTSRPTLREIVDAIHT